MQITINLKLPLGYRSLCSGTKPYHGTTFSFLFFSSITLKLLLLLFLNSSDNTEIDTNYHDVVDGFEKMGLKPDLLRGIYSYGYERPSAIQQRAIKPSIEGHDVIAQAQSGTGKTATFAISLLQRCDCSSSHCQGLILAPTRELARQIRLVWFVWIDEWFCYSLPMLIR